MLNTHQDITSILPRRLVLGCETRYGCYGFREVFIYKETYSPYGRLFGAGWDRVR